MRRHEAVARIFLFLSIGSFTSVGVALPQTPTMHGMRVDLVAGAEGVTEASERGHTQSEESPEWSGRPSTAGHLHSDRFDMATAQSLNERADPDPENNKFFNEELNRKMKEYLILGAIAGVFIGIGNGIQKQIMGTVSPGASTVQLGRRAVEPLNEHRQDQEDPVSPARSLSNMSDGDLKMLSIISRRMLNSLD